jgi:signal transduction histidine kinase
MELDYISQNIANIISKERKSMLTEKELAAFLENTFLKNKNITYVVIYNSKMEKMFTKYRGKGKNSSYKVFYKNAKENIKIEIGYNLIKTFLLSTNFLLFVAYSICCSIVLSLVIYSITQSYIKSFLKGLGLKKISIEKLSLPLTPANKAELEKIITKFNNLFSTVDILYYLTKVSSPDIDINETINNMINIISTQYDDILPAILLLSDDGVLRVKSKRKLSENFAKKIKIYPEEDNIISRAFKQVKLRVIQDLDSEEDKNDPIYQILKEESVNSYLLLPLVVRGKSTGLLWISSTQKNRFTEELIQMFTTLSDSLSLYLYNSQLYQRIRNFNRRLEQEIASTTRELTETNNRLIQRVKQLHLLYDIAVSISTSLDINKLCAVLVEKTKLITSAEMVGLLLYDEQKNTLNLIPPSFEIKEVISLQLKHENIFTKAFNSSQPLLLNEVGETVILPTEVFKNTKVESLLCIPLCKNSSNNIGLLALVNKKGAPFTQDDLYILTILSKDLTEVLENINLYHKLESHINELNLFREISSAITSQPVLEEVIQKVSLVLEKYFKGATCNFFLYDERTGELVLQRNSLSCLTETISTELRISIYNEKYYPTQAFRSCKSVLINNLKESNNAYIYRNINSLLAVPLIVENEPIGVVQIASGNENFFSEDDMRVVNLISHQIGVIIENARLYKKLYELNQELEKLNRSKSEFISIISHELRTPLTTMKGFVKVLLEEDVGALNVQQKKFLTVVENAVERLSLLISDLLDISRIESGQFKVNIVPTSLDEIITHSVENIKNLVESKNIQLTIKLSKTPPVLADRIRIGQVMDNLLSNAVKFTDYNGKITITTEDRGDWVLVSVKDTGVGIPAKDLDKVFEKFYQVETSAGGRPLGVGLGLAIAKSIIELHNGHIWVESELGKGSNFQFLLPVAKNLTQKGEKLS